MTFWLLYILIDGSYVDDYPYHFAFKDSCEKVGEKIVKDYKYAGYKCVKEVRK